MYGTPVLLQATLKLELSWTVRTEIGIFVTVYLTHMATQHCRQFEPLATLRARERPLIGVFQDDVPPQQTRPLEADSTLAAHMRSEIKMNFLMRVPRTGLRKSFAAETARIRPLSRVRSHVLREGFSKCTSTSTHVANKRFVFTTVVFMHVLIQEFHFPVLFIAFGARVPFLPVGCALVMF